MAQPYRNVGSIEATGALVSATDQTGAAMDYDAVNGYAQVTAKASGVGASLGLRFRALVAGVLTTLLSFAPGTTTAVFAGAISAPTIVGGMTISTGNLALPDGGAIQSTGSVILNYDTSNTGTHVISFRQDGSVVGTITGAGAFVWGTDPGTTALVRIGGAMTISGTVKVSSGSQFYLDGGTNTYFQQQSANTLTLVVGGSPFVTHDSGTSYSTFGGGISSAILKITPAATTPGAIYVSGSLLYLTDFASSTKGLILNLSTNLTSVLGSLQVAGAAGINGKAAVANVTAPTAAGAAYTATEQTLLNDIRTRLINFGIYT